jgi:hypothetical protein
MKLSIIGLLLTAALGCSPRATRAGAAPPAGEDGWGERRSPDESALDEEIAGLSVAALKKDGGAAKGLMTRDVHAKAHGCVRATFTVDRDVPAAYRAGVFAEPGRAYPAWIRFSNGSSKIQADGKADARGMAIKLMGVEGAKLLDRERDARTQDFVLITGEAFFVKDARDYADFFRRVAKGSNPAWFFFGRLPWRWTEFRAAAALLKGGKAVKNPLFAPYFSATPYRLGEKGVVKYSARPCPGSAAPAGGFAGERDSLRLNMRRSLDVREGKPACFQFLVQTRADPATMSVEDSRVPWDRSRAAFTPVATVLIPVQEFSSERQDRFCENLSFTPWHALPEHRPLGNINRTRKAVYEAVSAFRHQVNGQVRREPSADDQP